MTTKEKIDFVGGFCAAWVGWECVISWFGFVLNSFAFRVRKLFWKYDKYMKYDN